MPCLFAVFALAAPRLMLGILWFFTTWFRGLFDSVLWPLLGFIFLPTTLLWYWFAGQWTLWPVVGLVVALAIDVSPASGRRARQRVA